ncbi:MAG: hypothetical protein IKV94_00160 [Clostridia bacterium]|nr:hypothetical protein [Clostridia bacterium]
MSKNIIITEKEISYSFFDEDSLAEQIQKTFEALKSQIEDKIYYLIRFIYDNSPYEIVYYPISYEEVYSSFKKYFLSQVLNQAVIISLTEKGKYNVVSNALELITKENLQKEIDGSSMCSAISKKANNILWKPDFDPVDRDRVIKLLIAEFYKKENV